MRWRDRLALLVCLLGSAGYAWDGMTGRGLRMFPKFSFFQTPFGQFYNFACIGAATIDAVVQVAGQKRYPLCSLRSWRGYNPYDLKAEFRYVGVSSGESVSVAEPSPEVRGVRESGDFSKLFDGRYKGIFLDEYANITGRPWSKISGFIGVTNSPNKILSVWCALPCFGIEVLSYIHCRGSSCVLPCWANLPGFNIIDLVKPIYSKGLEGHKGSLHRFERCSTDLVRVLHCAPLKRSKDRIPNSGYAYQNRKDCYQRVRMLRFNKDRKSVV